jgi:hypothetical protein
LAINVILKAAMTAPQNCESFLYLIFDRIGGDRGSVCATGRCFDAFFRSELTEGGTPGVTAIRALRMLKNQLQVGHTINPSDSGRRASERPPCCGGRVSLSSIFGSCSWGDLAVAQRRQQLRSAKAKPPRSGGPKECHAILPVRGGRIQACRRSERWRVFGRVVLKKFGDVPGDLSEL